MSLPPRHKSTRNTVLLSGTHAGHRVKVESIVLLSYREYPACSQRAKSYYSLVYILLNVSNNLLLFSRLKNYYFKLKYRKLSPR